MPNDLFWKLLVAYLAGFFISKIPSEYWYIMFLLAAAVGTLISYWSQQKC